MSREYLVALLVHALERSTERLRAVGYENPWPEDLRARDIVRLLRERAHDTALQLYEESGC